MLSDLRWDFIVLPCISDSVAPRWIDLPHALDPAYPVLPSTMFPYLTYSLTGGGRHIWSAPARFLLHAFNALNIMQAPDLLVRYTYTPFSRIALYSSRVNAWRLSAMLLGVVLVYAEKLAPSSVYRFPTVKLPPLPGASAVLGLIISAYSIFIFMFQHYFSEQ